MQRISNIPSQITDKRPALAFKDGLKLSTRLVIVSMSEVGEERTS
jgi:hypothetical protein